jgi:hypothetical protein
MQHRNPYSAKELEGVYRGAGGELPTENLRHHEIVTQIENLPAILLLVAPLAMLPYGLAETLWLVLLTGSFTLAACLVWDVSARSAPRLSLLLICVLMANSEILFMTGNSAGLAVGLCVMAVWCFLNQRFAAAGVVCLAVSLALKPHDAGLVWLYFLLAGGVYRKRAIQTVALTVALGLVAVAWVTWAAPHWFGDWRSNLAALSARGGFDDPGLTSLTGHSAGMVIDLQGAVSVLLDDARIDNLVSYLVCGALLLAWSVRTLRLHFSQRGAWLALAAVVPLTMLVTYHRTYDAKLLLITVPACAMLWVEGGFIRWIALVVNTAGLVVTGDISLTVLMILARHWHAGAAGILGGMLTIVLMRPTPLVLLAMGGFYLWVYVRRDPARDAMPRRGRSREAVLPPTPA